MELGPDIGLVTFLVESMELIKIKKLPSAYHCTGLHPVAVGSLSMHGADAKIIFC